MLFGCLVVGCLLGLFVNRCLLAVFVVCNVLRVGVCLLLVVWWLLTIGCCLLRIVCWLLLVDCCSCLLYEDRWILTNVCDLVVLVRFAWSVAYYVVHGV